MKSRRTSRIVVALVALMSLLFMQLAVASYACPNSGNSEAVAADCANMDTGQPSLCKAKAIDQVAKQSLDKPDAPPVMPFIPFELVGLVLLPVWTALPEYAAAPPDWGRQVAPPIAIAHCCFRN